MFNLSLRSSRKSPVYFVMDRNVPSTALNNNIFFPSIYRPEEPVFSHSWYHCFTGCCKARNGSVLGRFIVITLVTLARRPVSEMDLLGTFSMDL